MELGTTAYVDESFHEHPTQGFYVLAAAVFDADLDQARAAMLALRGSRHTAKLHWNEMDADQQHTAAGTVADLGGRHLVTVGSPVPPKGQRRARRMSLRRLVYELHATGVTHLLMESRQRVLDRQDVELVTATRNDLPKGTRLRVDHQRGAEEPLFWVADIVAGAVSADRQGSPRYRELLTPAIRVIEVMC